MSAAAAGYDLAKMPMAQFVVNRCDGKMALELITRHPVYPTVFVKFLPIDVRAYRGTTRSPA